MLVQSHDPHGDAQTIGAVQAGRAGFIHLLPALPKALPNGRVTGLVARGGFVVDLAWKDGRLTEATIKSRRGLPLTIRYRGEERSVEIAAGEEYRMP